MKKICDYKLNPENMKKINKRNQSIKAKPAKLQTPKMRLTLGWFMISYSCLVLLSIIFVKTDSVIHYFNFTMFVLFGIRILLTQEEYKQRFELIKKGQILAKPVNADGEEFVDQTKFLRKKYFNTNIDRYSIDKYFSYIYGLIILALVGYLLKDIGSVTTDEILYVLPFIAALVYFTLIFVIYRIVQGKKLETRTRNQRIVFLIDIVALLTLFIVFTLNISPNNMVSTITIGFTSLLTIIFVVLLY